jgi:hypothetical protein
MNFHQARTYVGHSFRFLSLLLFCYVSCFILMMSWLCPSYDPDACVHRESSYLMIGDVRVPGGFTIYCPAACWANKVFLPIDWCLRGLKDLFGCPFGWTGKVALDIFWTVFGLTLFMPFWFSIFFMSRESRRTFKVRLFLSLVPAVWYVALIALYHFILLHHVPPLVGQPVAVIGTLGAIIAIMWAGRGRWCILIAPLLISILAGTTWIVFSVPE